MQKENQDPGANRTRPTEKREHAGKKKRVLQEAKTAAETRPDALSLYTACKTSIEKDGMQALPDLLQFLWTPTEMFEPPALPVFPGAHAGTVHDAALYYSIASETYYKLMILFEFTGLNLDTPGEYELLDDALVSANPLLKQCKLPNEQTRHYIVGAYHTCVQNYREAGKLLMASRIIPEPAKPFTTLRRALDYMLIMADSLYNLARIGSADVYVQSGFVGPEARNVPGMANAYGNMLQKYCTVVDKCIASGN